MYYDDRYGKDVFCRRSGRDRRVHSYSYQFLPDPRTGLDRRIGTIRPGVAVPLSVVLVLLGLSVGLGYVIALAATTAYLP